MNNCLLITILFTETVDTRTLIIGGRMTFYDSSDFMDSLSYTLLNSTSVSGSSSVYNYQAKDLEARLLSLIWSTQVRVAIVSNWDELTDGYPTLVRMRT